MSSRTASELLKAALLQRRKMLAEGMNYSNIEFHCTVQEARVIDRMVSIKGKEGEPLKIAGLNVVIQKEEKDHGQAFHCGNL